MSNRVKTSGGLPPAEPVQLAAFVDYAPGAIVSRALTQTQAGSVTLFALDAGQEISEHTTPFDAYVQVLDGVAELTIGGKPITARAGETVLMPAGVPHALTARERFKMLLSMIRG